jgi:hypothetical protein
MHAYLNIHLHLTLLIINQINMTGYMATFESGICSITSSPPSPWVIIITNHHCHWLLRGVLATSPKFRFSSGSESDLEPDHFYWFLYKTCSSKVNIFCTN